MSRQLIVLRTEQSLSQAEAMRVKEKLQNALLSGILVLGHGLDLKIVDIDEKELHCEYCGNQIDKCWCGAARIKVKIETNTRIPQWEIEGLANDAT
jgi:hypothetical protein